MRATASILRFGAFELNLEEKVLRENGAVVPLRARPFDLLRVLLEHAGRLVTKEQLLDLAWPGLVVEENNLAVQILALRKVLGSSAIATVPGRGYRFALALDGDMIVSDETKPAAGALPAVALFGRDADLDALATELSRNRLVSIVGSGGIGKTSLATALRGRVARDFVDGTAWVELGRLRDGDLLPPYIARACGVDLGEGQSDLDTLVHALRGKSMLVFLDNVEHLVASVASTVHGLLARTRALKVVTTSQAPLRIAGECVYRVAPLAFPPPGTAVGHAGEYSAVSLFAERARAADRRFHLTPENTGAVVEICRRLDGIPLAIELAAARVPLLGVAGLAARLDDRFGLLRHGQRDAPDRQQTLKSMLDWSYQLLGAAEQQVFRRLGALYGPFSLEQACRMARGDDAIDDADLLDALAALVERSLVVVSENDPPAYTLLETAREYALAQLRLAGDHAAIERASLEYEGIGDRASGASESVQALTAYSQAMDLAASLPRGPARAQRELHLGLKLGPAIQTALGPSHPRCEAIYREAVERSRSNGAGPAAFQAMWGYWHFLCMCGRDRDAAPLADDITRLAATLGDESLELEAAHAALTTQQLLGNAPAMLSHARRAIALYRPDAHHQLAFAYGGHDPGICALGQAAVGLWLTGQDDEAHVMARRALDAGVTIEHAYSRAVSYYYPALMYAAAGDNDRLRHCAQRLTELSDRHAMQLLRTEGLFFLGRADFIDGAHAAGLAAMRGALAEIEGGGELAFVLSYSALLADALLSMAQADEARALLERAIGHAAAGQGFFLPELFRLRAATRGGRDARDDLARAHALAAEQGATRLARRALRDLERLQGHP